MNNSKFEIVVLSVIAIVFFIVLLGNDFASTGEFNSISASENYYRDNSTMMNAAVIYLDNMNGANDTSALKSRGYKVYNRGTSPQGTSAIWFQGNTAFFNAYEGPTTGYVACNFRIASFTSTIDSWLVTPKMTVFVGDTLSFYSRSKDNSTYPDSFRVMYSPTGDSVPEANWTELGRYKVSTSGWVLKKFIATATGGNARFAIRFSVVNGGPGGTNGEYSGIDLIKVSRGPGACQFTWSQRLVVSDAGNVIDSLRFGVSSAGTNGVDTCLGEYSIPPAPPAGAFDCRFVLPDNDAVRRDIRNDSSVNRTWRMTFQPSASGYPITFNWNPATLPALGSFTLKDEVNGTLINVNMRNQTSYTLSNSGITSLKIEYQLYSLLTVSVTPDWNMVSVPLLATDMNYNILFPGVASQAYKYRNGYIPVQVLSNGVGYWMKFNSATNYVIQGTPYQPEWMYVEQGWNIIGPFTQNIPVSTILSNPSGIINSNFFAYENGYIARDTLKIGKGYWVLTTGAGYLYKGTSDNPLFAGNAEQQMENFSELVFTSGENRRALLYLGSSNEMTSGYDLPPVPPAGIFDVRFGTDKFAEVIGHSHTIKLSGNTEETRLTFRNMKGMSFKLRDAIDGTILNKTITEGTEIVIPANMSSLILETMSITPQTYELEQNYPNPFNPSTMIKYQTANDGLVKLAVYDMLGREVKSLVNNFQPAGTYEIVLDASELTSGVYFYRLTSGSFEEMRKMIVVK
jgi:hypothetical protein